MTTRVLLADDHHLVRAGIASLLRDAGGVDIVGEAANGQEAVRLTGELQPDLLLIDLSMPGMSGLEAISIINEAQPKVRVIVLSMHISEEYVLRVFLQGAAGYLLKDSAPEELPLAIAAVMRGDLWLSAAVSKMVVAGYLDPATLLDKSDGLTPRQRQVLKMIAQGKTTKAISSDLSLSVKTIETYRAQIMERLDIHDLAGLVRYAIRQGITPL
ncbi:response regulator transcription factor [Rhodocyclus tenuis]|uniref:Response regulator transcription factor n=1 Tax=Rhodocyclus gracilis TaxID=2929842 RepID=A0ABX0WEM1_9RHOO|nr:response regulator transcription factor [Rhodocyclus gracilis]NJA88165.1 response regulator transcription factor [Rhodocyclus gracilis]